MKETITYYRDASQLRGLLSKFQDAVDRKEYTEKIPYDTWRKLMKQTGAIKIDYTNPFVKIYAVVPDVNDINQDVIIYSAKIYDWGFGRFFYDEVIKKEWNEDMTLNSAKSATFSCDAADINRNVWDQLTGISTTQYIDTGVDATKLETKADYMSYFDSDSATGCSNYGTTTNHTIKINGDPLSSNSIYMTKDDYHGIWGDTGTAVTNISTIGDRVDTLESQMEQLMNKNEKENDNMKGFNFDFGPCTNDNVRMSMYGVAVKNAAGTYVSYNPKTKEIVDVDILNFDGAKYMYKVPVALSQVAIGDIVIHNRKPMFVVDADLPGKNLTVVDVCAGEQKTVIPTVNMFGFNFITKIVSLMDMCGGANTASAEQPFGNMLPLLMLNGDNKDIDPMMLMLMMGQSNGMNFATNPMMLYALMNGNKTTDPMMLFALSGMMNPAKTSCDCGCGNAEKQASI